MIDIYFLFIYIYPPIHIAGLSEYGNERKKVDIELINNGNSPINIIDVHINNKKVEDVKLVLSYTLQLALSGIDNDPYAKFVNIDEYKINPAYSRKQINQLKFPHTKPISYGLRINSEETINHVKIVYKYKGLKLVKTFYWDRWLQ